MIRLEQHQLEHFRSAVRDAAARHDVRAAIDNVYRALQDRIDLRRPICTTSGRCCRFDEFGHRLFVTTMELAAFIARLPPSPATPGEGWGEGSAGFGGCPFQSSNLCSVHTIRPFGCRVFFCDETSTEWQRDQYEFFQQELKRLHERLNVPYFYVEWREALEAVSRDPVSL